MPREILMGGVAVDDSLNNPAGWHRALKGIEKADELLLAESCWSGLRYLDAEADDRAFYWRASTHSGPSLGSRGADIPGRDQ